MNSITKKIILIKNSGWLLRNKTKIGGFISLFEKVKYYLKLFSWHMRIEEKPQYCILYSPKI